MVFSVISHISIRHILGISSFKLLKLRHRLFQCVGMCNAHVRVKFGDDGGIDERVPMWNAYTFSQVSCTAFFYLQVQGDDHMHIRGPHVVNITHRRVPVPRDLKKVDMYV